MSDLSKPESWTAGEFWHRVVSLASELGLQMIGWANATPHGALAEYNGANFIFYRTDLSERDQAMTVLHELGHAYLHPPGFGEFAGEGLDEDEEQLVHNAAAIASEALGFPEYVDAMGTHGAPVHLLAVVPPEKQNLVREIASFLETGVRNPEQPQPWPR